MVRPGRAGTARRRPVAGRQHRDPARRVRTVSNAAGPARPTPLVAASSPTPRCRLPRMRSRPCWKASIPPRTSCGDPPPGGGVGAIVASGCVVVAGRHQPHPPAAESGGRPVLAAAHLQTHQPRGRPGRRSPPRRSGSPARRSPGGPAVCITTMLALEPDAGAPLRRAPVQGRDRPRLPDGVGAPQQRRRSPPRPRREVAQLAGVRVVPLDLDPLDRAVRRRAPRSPARASGRGRAAAARPSEPATSSSARSAVSTPQSKCASTPPRS